MENSNNAQVRLWLRTAARSLLQCHRQLSDTDEQTDSLYVGDTHTPSTNDEFLSQIKTYLNQLDVSELIEVIQYLTHDISKHCQPDEAQEKKFLCYRGITTSYVSTNEEATKLEDISANEPDQKKKVRYYRGVPIEY